MISPQHLMHGRNFRATRSHPNYTPRHATVLHDSLWCVLQQLGRERDPASQVLIIISRCRLSVYLQKGESEDFHLNKLDAKPNPLNSIILISVTTFLVKLSFFSNTQRSVHLHIKFRHITPPQANVGCTSTQTSLHRRLKQAKLPLE
jgi:hypothetical protein